MFLSHMVYQSKITKYDEVMKMVHEVRNIGIMCWSAD